MYKVIYMKADFEPWWQFDGWQNHIVEQKEFQHEADAKKALQQYLEVLSRKYSHKRNEKERFWAFWSEEEIEFCEACDDDIQTFHGVIWEEVQSF